MSGTLLPLPDDPRLTWLEANFAAFVSSWQFPRSRWLHEYENVLRSHYPAANSDSLTLTARTAAPFPLALPGVP